MKKTWRKPIQVTWAKPTVRWWKLNCDGASKGNPGMAGAGGVLRDIGGELVAAFSIFLGNSTNTFAELAAIVEGISIAYKYGITHLWIECDAMVMLYLLNGQTVKCIGANFWKNSEGLAHHYSFCENYVDVSISCGCVDNLIRRAAKIIAPRSPSPVDTRKKATVFHSDAFGAGDWDMAYSLFVLSNKDDDYDEHQHQQPKQINNEKIDMVGA
ncbi:hypothetical protein Pfo_011629 [Paulownia fortunei]|nr:hypothetical protein Pfo_011629 [Paulownia fortunei]